MVELTKTLKDAAYITVGLGVIGFQKAQVRRQELKRQLETQLQEARGQAQRLAKDLESKNLVKHARDTAKDVQHQLLELVGRNGHQTAA